MSPLKPLLVVVERTFSWLGKCRRLAVDYERKPEHHRAWVQWAMVRVMVRRLARPAPPLPVRARSLAHERSSARGSYVGPGHDSRAIADTDQPRSRRLRSSTNSSQHSIGSGPPSLPVQRSSATSIKEGPAVKARRFSGNR